jgi:hypothetical protein
MRNKTYNINPTKEQLAIIRLYWNMFQAEYNIFWGKLGSLEKEMSKKTGIKGLEFFQSDGDWCGVGNEERTIKLIHGEDLDE